MNILFAAIGLALLLLGGNFVVRGALGLSHRLQISPLLVGIVIIGFGTSLPEVAVSIQAALEGSPGLAIGNVIGSNIANTLLILGFASLIFPVAVNTRHRTRDITALTMITLMFVGIGFTLEQIEWWYGIIMIAALLVYISLAAYQGAETLADDGDGVVRETASPLMIGLSLVIGFVAILGGAELLVAGAVGLSEQLGVPDEVIGLTVIAIGTSLPEMATTFAAAWQRNTQLCFGNVIGSNLFNISGIAGLTALVSPLPFSQDLLGFDLWILAVTTLLLALIMLRGKPISRCFGLSLVLVYGVYLGAHANFLVA